MRYVAPPPGPAIWPTFAMGAAFGLLVYVGSRLTVDRLEWARELALWFREIVGPLRTSDAFILALLSGIAEEMLFRGAALQTFGLLVSSLVFAVVHFPPKFKLFPWTLIALALGLLFGHAVEVTGNLSFPISAHFTINFLNLQAVGKLPPPEREQDLSHLG